MAAMREALVQRERGVEETYLPPARRRIACASRARRNPYLDLLYTNLSSRGLRLVDGVHPQAVLSPRWLFRRRSDVGFIHFHWPQNIYARSGGPAVLRPFAGWYKLARLLVRLAIARRLDYRLVWTIHQVHPHDSTMPRRDAFVARYLARRCHLLLAHDRATADEARAHLGDAAERIEIVAHGSYMGVYREGRSRREVRAELGIAEDAFVLLSFGAIRPYKDLDVLLEAFASTSSRVGALVIAGNPMDDGVVHQIAAAAAADPRIKPLLRYVDDDQVAELFRACDAAVLSRGDGGTSGALILALSLGLPVVAADTPLYRELTRDFRAGWSFRPGHVASLTAALESAAADPAGAYAKGRRALEIAESLDWGAIADRTAELLLAARRTTTRSGRGLRSFVGTA